MSRDDVIFGLAAAGYVMLAKDTALRLAGRRWTWIATATAIAVAVHVGLVWAYRFDWSVQRAWEKSPEGFLIFHVALLAIVVTPALGGRLRDRVTTSTFLVVSTAVLPAPLRYPEISVLAIPLWAAFAGVVAVFLATRLNASSRGVRRP